MDRRFFVAGLLAIAMVGVVLTGVRFDGGPDDMPSSATPVVTIDGPDGRIWSGAVVAEPGTAFHALLAASAVGGFEVEWSGSEGNRFVESIAGHGGAGTAGWCVQVDGADSPVSVDRFPVEDGQTVRWYWADDGCERF